MNRRAVFLFAGSFHHLFTPEGCGRMAAMPPLNFLHLNGWGLKPNAAAVLIPTNKTRLPIICFDLIAALLVASRVGNLSPLPDFPGQKSKTLMRSNRSRYCRSLMPNSAVSFEPVPPYKRGVAGSPLRPGACPTSRIFTARDYNSL